jgi:EAL domain-containing protein (putative c-di-GMP-specific phosphodiesterase class I)
LKIDTFKSQAIVSMMHSLGLEVIAEGVEAESKRDFLKMLGCLAY